MPRTRQRAALAGFALGLLGMGVIAFATPLAWPWYTVTGSTATFVIGLIASRVWPAPETPAAV